MNTSNEAIGEYLKKRRLQRHLSLRELAKRAEVATGTISALERGLSIPETETVLKIARALDLDEFHILRLLAESQGNEVAIPILDPSAAYIAKRLSELPPSIRERAIDALGGQLDVITVLAEWGSILEEARRLDPEVVAELEAKVRERRRRNASDDDTTGGDS